MFKIRNPNVIQQVEEWPFKSIKGYTTFFLLFALKLCFSWLEIFFSKYFFKETFFLVLTSGTCFGFNDFKKFYIHKNWRQPPLYQLFTMAAHISTFVESKQMKLGFVITNDKGIYVAKGDSICLFSVQRSGLEKTTNKTLCPLMSYQ